MFSLQIEKENSSRNSLFILANENFLHLTILRYFQIIHMSNLVGSVKGSNFYWCSDENTTPLASIKILNYIIGVLKL